MAEIENKLILADGTEIQFAAGSTIRELIGVYSSFAEVDAVRALLTDENLKGATFNGEVVENVIRYDLSVTTYKDGENLEVHFRNMIKNDVDILKEQVTELQKALAEIIG